LPRRIDFGEELAAQHAHAHSVQDLGFAANNYEEALFNMSQPRSFFTV
jgi:hypothetical protein